MPDAAPGQEPPASFTLEQLYDFFNLGPDERRPDVVEEVPSVVLGGGVRRYLREQVITWASLGGTEPRARARARRRRPLLERESA
jgi:hypothetical protein